MTRRADPGPRPMLRVVAIGWPVEQRVALLNQLGYVFRAGGEPILIVDDREAWEPIARPIRVIEVPARRALTPVDRAVAITPGRWASSALTLNRARRSRSLFRRFFLLVLAWSGLRRRSRLRPPWWRWWTSTQFYADTRGWANWIAIENQLFDIEPGTLDYVLLRDVSAWPIAWHLARLAPQVRVGASVPAEVLSEFAADYQHWLRSQPRQLGRRIRQWLRFLPVRLVRSRPAKWLIGRLPRGLKDKAKRVLAVR